VADTKTVLNEQLLRGDFFLCASTKQRDFWLGQLAALGRINPATYDEDETLQRLITVVPFGIDGEPPSADRGAIRGVIPGIGEHDKVVLWGGGVYNWFDPITLVHAIDRLRVRLPEVRLVFMGIRHPNPEIPTMRVAYETMRLSDELGLTGQHVFFNETWVPFEERARFLLDADVGVSTHLHHVETEFSFRTRILDYFWAQLPVVCTGGDALGALIDEHGLGITVPPNDVEALERALESLLTDDAFAARCRSNIEKVSPALEWGSVLRPLLEFCRAPRRAPDLVDPDRLIHLGITATLPRRHGWRADLQLVLRYLRDGGVPLLVARVRSRISRKVGSRKAVNEQRARPQEETD
jgi:glycosyltransferase involved in cell wall biosynthesis